MHSLQVKETTSKSDYMALNDKIVHIIWKVVQDVVVAKSEVLPYIASLGQDMNQDLHLLLHDHRSHSLAAGSLPRNVHLQDYEYMVS